MAVFESCSVLLELKTLPFKEKKKLKSAITENGGNICFVVNKQCSLIVTSDVSSLSSNRLRSIQKHQTPVVDVDYVYSCLNRGVLLPVDQYKLHTSFTESSSPPLRSSPKRGSLSHQVPTSRAVPEPHIRELKPKASDSLSQRAETPERSRNVLEKFRIYTETDSDLPTYPDNFQVAKYSVFQKINSNTWCVLELQSVRGENRRQYRVVCYWKNDIESKKAAVKDKLVFLPTSEDALEVYLTLRESLQNTGLQLRLSIPPQAQDLGSGPLQQLLLEEKLNTESLSQEVGVFVELLWTEALGCLENILRVPIDRLSLNDVSRAEGLLLQAQRKLKEGSHTEAASLLEDVYTLLPHRAPQLLPSAKLISQKLDLCQVIRDVLNVSEMTLRSPAPSSVGKYRALRCSIEAVPRSSSDFQAVTALLQDSKVTIKQVLRVSRGVELQMFQSELGNIKPLLHSSSPSYFVGILSRGLLLPRVGVEHHGIERTDAGNLGSGIYFSDAVSTSLKYSKPNVTDGSRMLLVCDVALGSCKDLHKRDFTLKQAPEGHHSVHGVHRTPKVRSEFEDDEYVVYSPDQVKLKYVVQFSVEGDQLKEFSPPVNTSPELGLPSTDQEVSTEDDGVESIKNPLEDVKAGLLDSAGQQLPLQAVHVKCKLIDLLSQVIIFQKYTNTSSVPIEAKYVFPLDDSAAVCGFEAFINGKHVVGQVKEKETARREYKQAIERGHGAYLMDQDAPDVFTISVGNLPPGATVLIKVTFVSELIVRDGSIFFSLPGSVAPWQERAALNQTTQVTLEKVCVTDEASSSREFTLDMSVEMPYEIFTLQCVTHKVKIKRTDCKAVVSVLPEQVMGSEGFQLSITLSDVHLPRMWVEKHPDKDSQACMLVFYPDFDIKSSSASDEVVLLLDTSESMKGESLRMAQRIALQVLKTLDKKLRINVILFGTDHKEAFLTARPLVEARQEAEHFLKLFTPVGGSTELWQPLRALNLLPPTRGIRNLLLLSDGHIQNAELTLKLLRDNAQHSRLFTCGLSPTANRHLLRALAQAGGGAYEFFDTKTKHNWAEKVACQVKRMASPGCSSVSVKWQQFSMSAPTPVQAPKQIHALFSDCHTLVYGFVPHCTQATLLGNLSGQELKTMVSTSELQKTRGTFLHKLTARALIRDYEDGNLDTDEAEHEGKKAELKSYIVELSKEFSILSQFTSFVAVEERDSEQTEQGFTDVPKVIAEEDVDILPYISWTSGESEEEEDDDIGYGCFDTYELRSYPSPIAACLECDIEEFMGGRAIMSMSSTAVEDFNFALPLKIVHSPSAPPISPLHSLGMVTKRPSALQLPLSLGSRYSQSVSPPRDLFPNYLSTCFVPPPVCGSAALLPPFRVGAGLCVAPPLTAPSFTPLSLADHSSSDMLPKESEILGVLAVKKAGKTPEEHRAMSENFMHLEAAEVQSSANSIQFMDFGSKTAPAPVDFRKNASSASVPFGSSAVCFGGSFGYTGAKESPFGFIGDSHTQRRKDLVFGSQLDRIESVVRTSPQEQCWRRRSVEQTAVSETLLCSETADFVEEAQSSADSIQFMNFAARSAPAPVDLTKKASPASVPLMGSARSFASIIAEPGAKASPFGFIGSLTGESDASQTEGFKQMLAGSLFGSEQAEMEPQSFIRTVHRAMSKKRLKRTSVVPDALKLKWTKIFQMQDTEGYWELTTELGELINVDVDTFANVFLKNKGINSLGVRARADILKLVATLLVLQLMRVEKLEEGKLLRTLFSLDEVQPRPERWEQVKRAVDWVCWADQQYPCAYSRLEFGLSWESSTRQLLGREDLPPFSPLGGLNLQKTSAPLTVH